MSIDFDQESLKEKLFESGYDKDLKTLFIWEGVTYFLTADAIDSTLAFVSGYSGKGSSIVFDYIFKSAIRGDYDSAELRREQKVLEKLGEPYVFGIEEGEARQFLEERGFSEVTEIDHSYIKQHYFGAANQNSRYTPYLPITHATVAPSS